MKKRYYVLYSSTTLITLTPLKRKKLSCVWDHVLKLNEDGHLFSWGRVRRWNKVTNKRNIIYKIDVQTKVSGGYAVDSIYIIHHFFQSFPS